MARTSPRTNLGSDADHSEAKTTTTADGVTHVVTGVVDTQGETIDPASSDDLARAVDRLEVMERALRALVLHAELISGTTFQLDKD